MSATLLLSTPQILRIAALFAATLRYAGTARRVPAARLPAALPLSAIAGEQHLGCQLDEHPR